MPRVNARGVIGQPRRPGRLGSGSARGRGAEVVFVGRAWGGGGGGGGGGGRTIGALQ